MNHQIKMNDRLANSVPTRKSRNITQQSSFNPFDDSNGNMMQYVSVGVAAIAMGVCIFLYKEVKNVKSNVSDISEEIKKINENEQLTENTKTIQNLEEKVNQIGSLIQHLASRQIPGRPPQTPPPVIQPKIVPMDTSSAVPEKINNLPMPVAENSHTKIVEGGPGEEESSKEMCDDEGVCKLDSKKVLDI